jgi:hypothetical protein
MATPFPFTAAQVLTAAQMNAITTLPINDQTASYTAVVGDVGKRIVMDVASANTLTIDDSIFGVGDTIFIANKGAGTCTITPGSGVTINTSGSLALAQHGGGTLVALSASVFTFFSGGGVNYGTATGGSSSSITVGGVAYTLLTFTSDSTLTVTKNGLFDCTIIAGGGGGSRTGGGGAGGLLQSQFYFEGNQTVTVGAGGAAVLSGRESRVGNAFAFGGGAGLQVGPFYGNGQQGGSGAGAGIGGAAGIGVIGLGNNGGAAGSDAGGGGGGASAVGSNGVTTTGGAGGAGTDIGTWLGAGSTFLAGGGGGGGSGAGGAGGAGGGGAGTTTTGNAGTANTGGGGGGGYSTDGGAGGSGIVYVRFKS